LDIAFYAKRKAISGQLTAVRKSLFFSY